MTKIRYKSKLGYGVYTIPDISKLLGIDRRKVNRYISEYWDERTGRKLFNDSYSWKTDKSTKAVNFFVLIELFSFFRLQELGVKTRKILKSREQMAEELKVEYPFASAPLLTDGNKIWYKFEEDIVNADGSSQTNFVKIIESFAKKVDFRPDNLAERFYPAGKSNSIVVDPHHQFGQPVIKGTNVNTEVIFSMYQSGEPIKAIGILYDLTEKEVNDAVNFYRKAA
ncbi:MAG: DUF433 domain-containing protein [Melioribacteraceae bacterium]|nr:DUF433 domain-containing protein [Melioribacteraceae bacterium]